MDTRTRTKLAAANLTSAEERWGPLSQPARSALQDLWERYQFSVCHGDVIFLGGCWYVSHPGLLRVARRNRCAGGLMFDQ
jgi:hypothetical protein